MRCSATMRKACSTAMGKTIQISNVPDELYAWLEAQAARKGRSLSDHLLVQLHGIARKPRRIGEPTWERLRFAQESLRWAKRYVEIILMKRYHRVLHERIIAERNTLVAHTDESRRQIEIHQYLQLHSGFAYGIGDEQFFESSLSLIERLLAAIQPEIARLEPVEYAKAEERRRQVTRPSQ